MSNATTKSPRASWLTIGNPRPGTRATPRRAMSVPMSTDTGSSSMLATWIGRPRSASASDIGTFIRGSLPTRANSDSSEHVATNATSCAARSTPTSTAFWASDMKKSGAPAGSSSVRASTLSRIGESRHFAQRFPRPFLQTHIAIPLRRTCFRAPR